MQSSWGAHCRYYTRSRYFIWVSLEFWITSELEKGVELLCQGPFVMTCNSQPKERWSVFRLSHRRRTGLEMMTEECFLSPPPPPPMNVTGRQKKMDNSGSRRLPFIFVPVREKVGRRSCGIRFAPTAHFVGEQRCGVVSPDKSHWIFEKKNKKQTKTNQNTNAIIKLQHLKSYCLRPSSSGQPLDLTSESFALQHKLLRPAACPEFDGSTIYVPLHPRCRASLALRLIETSLHPILSSACVSPTSWGFAPSSAARGCQTEIEATYASLTFRASSGIQSRVYPSCWAQTQQRHTHTHTCACEHGNWVVLLGESEREGLGGTCLDLI